MPRMATTPDGIVIDDPRLAYLIDEGQTIGYRAGVAHYPADVRHMVGEIKGPTTYQHYVVCTAVEYDPENGVSTAVFRFVGTAGTDRRTARYAGPR